MYICHCNYCENNYIDLNPSHKSIDYSEDTNLLELLFDYDIEDDEQDRQKCYICPKCKTDAYLVDNKILTCKEKYTILESLLISLHTSRWTANKVKFTEILEKIGAFSYARTNSNGFEAEEDALREKTLRDLQYL